MVNDWRSRIDDYHRRKEEEEAQKRKKESEEYEARLRREQERYKAEYEKQLAHHKRKFRCHMCGKPSDGPMKGSHYEWSEGGGERHYINWDSPTGLEKCDRCGKWTCKEHIYRGICSKCAGRL